MTVLSSIAHGLLREDDPEAGDGIREDEYELAGDEGPYSGVT